MSSTAQVTSFSTEDRASLHSHGYRVEGDVAFLNAELAIPETVRDDSLDWALQLWACEAPYGGGPLHGIKVAEAQLVLPAAPQTETPQLSAEAFANLPPGQRSYAMVMVLAAGARGVYDQVHDFCNYPARQQFSAPHFEGSVGYRIEQGAVVLSAERVKNPRAIGNVSGTLALELWALPMPYDGGEASGRLLAHVELDRLLGQSSHEDVARRVAINEPPPGDWYLTMMLREWTAASVFLTRDYCTFETRYHSAPVSRSGQTAHEDEDDSSRTRTRAPSTSLSASDTSEDGGAVEAPRLAPQPAKDTVPEPAPRVATPRAPQPAKDTVPEPAPRVATPLRAVRKDEEESPRKVSVRHASVEQLVRVPGLNRKLAAAIVRARPYASLDELTRVRGIGDRMLAKLKDHLTL